MKVVQELVAYFDRRGQLSKRQVRQLLDKGYLAADAPPHMLELGEFGRCELLLPGSRRRSRDRSGAPMSIPAIPALAPAAVHAGLVKPGDSAVVKVTVVAPPAQFQGCVRHGVTSHDFGRYGSAYRLNAI